MLPWTGLIETGIMLSVGVQKSWFAYPCMSADCRHCWITDEGMVAGTFGHCAVTVQTAYMYLLARVLFFLGNCLPCVVLLTINNNPSSNHRWT
jgi:hypothetical protein